MGILDQLWDETTGEQTEEPEVESEDKVDSDQTDLLSKMWDEVDSSKKEDMSDESTMLQLAQAEKRIGQGIIGSPGSMLRGAAGMVESQDWKEADIADWQREEALRRYFEKHPGADYTKPGKVPTEPIDPVEKRIILEQVLAETADQREQQLETQTGFNKEKRAELRKEQHDVLPPLLRKAAEAFPKVDEKRGFKEGTVAGWFEDVGVALGESALPMAATMVSGPGGFSLMYAQMYGDDYDKFRKKGLSEIDAGQAAMVSALPQAIMESGGTIVELKAAWKMLEKAAAKSPALSRVVTTMQGVLTGAAGETVEEVSQGRWSVVAETMALYPNDTPEQLAKKVREVWASPEFQAQENKSMSVAAGVGGLIPGAAAAARTAFDVNAYFKNKAEKSASDSAAGKPTVKPSSDVDAAFAEEEETPTVSEKDLAGTEKEVETPAPGRGILELPVDKVTAEERAKEADIARREQLAERDRVTGLQKELPQEPEPREIFPQMEIADPNLELEDEREEREAREKAEALRKSKEAELGEAPEPTKAEDRAAEDREFEAFQRQAANKTYTDEEAAKGRGILEREAEDKEIAEFERKATTAVYTEPSQLSSGMPDTAVAIAQDETKQDTELKAQAQAQVQQVQQERAQAQEEAQVQAQEQAQAQVAQAQQAQLRAQQVENLRFNQAMSTPEGAMTETSNVLNFLEKTGDKTITRVSKPIRDLHKALATNEENPKKLNSLKYEVNEKSRDAGKLDPKLSTVISALTRMADKRITDLNIAAAKEQKAKEAAKAKPNQAQDQRSPGEKGVDALIAQERSKAKPKQPEKTSTAKAELEKARAKTSEPTPKKPSKAVIKDEETGKTIAGKWADADLYTQAEEPEEVLEKEAAKKETKEERIKKDTAASQVDLTEIEDMILANSPELSTAMAEIAEIGGRENYQDWLNPGKMYARLIKRRTSQGTPLYKAKEEVLPIVQRYGELYEAILEELPSEEKKVQKEEPKSTKGKETKAPAKPESKLRKKSPQYMTGEGLSVKDVNRVVERAKIGLAKIAKIVVLKANEDLEGENDHLYNSMKREGALGHVAGLFDPNTKTIYLFSDVIQDKDSVGYTVMHELGHFSLDELLGDSLNPLLDRIKSKYQSEIKARIKQYEWADTIENRRRIANEILIDKFMDGSDPTLKQRLVDLINQFMKKLGFNAITEEDVNDLVKAIKENLTKGHAEVPANISTALSKGSPWVQPNYMLKSVQKKVHIRDNTPDEMRTYEVSVYPGEMAKIKDKKSDAELPTLKAARAINTNPERVKDWQKIYDTAAKMDKWADVKKTNKDGKLKDILVVSLTKGCQRTRTIIERVENGILPLETRIEACFGGDCWVNKQFNRLFSSFENMETRDLKLATKEQIKVWFKSKKVIESLKKTPFIRQGQQGDDSHLFASGVALEWLKQKKAAGITTKDIFISASYAPVTKEQYEELAEYKDLFEIHFSNSGWFHKNEVMIRLAEFQAAKDAGLNASIRLITNENKISGIEMVNEDFIRQQMKEIGVQQSEVLETPFHDDAAKGQKRSKPSGDFKFICCETGNCRTCGVHCMTAVHNGSVAASYSRTDIGEGTVGKEKKPETKKTVEATLEALKKPDLDKIAEPQYHIITKPPKKTKKGYKLCKVNKAGKIFPPIIEGKQPELPIGVWLEAEDLTGQAKKQGLAPRLGWHLGMYPITKHLTEKGRVWTEVEIADDVDWQDKAEETDTLDIRSEVPLGGHYKYPVPEERGYAWYIAGAMKINKILTPEEVEQIRKETEDEKNQAMKELKEWSKKQLAVVKERQDAKKKALKAGKPAPQYQLKTRREFAKDQEAELSKYRPTKAEVAARREKFEKENKVREQIRNENPPPAVDPKLSMSEQHEKMKAWRDDLNEKVSAAIAELHGEKASPQYMLSTNTKRWKESFARAQDIYRDTLDETVKAIRNADIENGEKQPWSVLPKMKVMKIWRDFMDAGYVKDEKGIDKIADRVARNIIGIVVNTDLIPSSARNAPRSADTLHIYNEYMSSLEESGQTLLWENVRDYLEMEGVEDEVFGRDNALRTSDFGLHLKDAVEVLNAATAEEKLLAVDRTFNKVHQRYDLASLFIEGGVRTLDEIAGKESEAHLTQREMKQQRTLMGEFRDAQKRAAEEALRNEETPAQLKKWADEVIKKITSDEDTENISRIERDLDNTKRAIEADIRAQRGDFRSLSRSLPIKWVEKKPETEKQTVKRRLQDIQYLTVDQLAKQLIDTGAKESKVEKLKVFLEKVNKKYAGLLDIIKSVTHAKLKGMHGETTGKSIRLDTLDEMTLGHEIGEVLSGGLTIARGQLRQNQGMEDVADAVAFRLMEDAGMKVKWTDGALFAQERADELLRPYETAQKLEELEEILDLIYENEEEIAGPQYYTPNLGPKGTVNPVKQMKRTIWETIKTNISDSKQALLTLEKGDYDAAVSGFKSFKLLHSFPTIFNNFLVHGVPKYVNNWISIMKDKSGGLFSVVKKLGKDHVAFFERLTAMSAQELLNDGRTNLFGLDDNGNMIDDQAMINKILKETEQDYQANKKVWDESRQRLREINKAVLDFIQECGLIDPETRAEWERTDYIPFFRMMEDWRSGEVQGLLPQKGSNIGTIKKLKGSEKNLNDPFANLVDQYAFLLNNALENVARKKSLAFAKQQGLIEEIKDFPGRPQGHEIDIRVKGKTKRFKVLDPWLYDALVDIDAHSNISKILTAPKRLLTWGVTQLPGFRLANFFRDTWHTFFIGNHFIPIYDSLKGVYHVWKETPEYVGFAGTGSAFGGSFKTHEMRAKTESAVKNLREKALGEKNWWTQYKDFWEKVGEASENAARMGLFLRLREHGVSDLEAGFQARDLLDFHNSGKAKWMQTLISSIPFLNARIQGLMKMGRNSVDQKTRNQFWLRGMIASTAAFMWGYYGADDDDEKVDYQKRTNLSFNLFGVKVKLPLPFETGAAFIVLPMALGEYFAGTRTNKELASMVGNIIMDTFCFNPVPQVIKPAVEQWANRDFFTGQKIVPEHMKNMEPELQVSPRTKEIYKYIGKAASAAGLWDEIASPLRIEKAMRGVFGTIADEVANAADTAIDYFTGKDPAGSNMDRLLSIAGAGRFVDTKDVPTFTKSQERYYDYAQDFDQAAVSYREMKKLDKAQAREYRSENKTEIRLSKTFGKYQEKISKLNAKMKLVHLSEKLSPEEKRDKLNELLTKRNEIFKKAVDKAKGKLEE